MPVRFWLGMAQMFGATTAAVLLFTTGLSTATLTMTTFTTACTVLSRILHRGGKDAPVRDTSLKTP